MTFVPSALRGMGSASVAFRLSKTRIEFLDTTRVPCRYSWGVSHILPRGKQRFECLGRRMFELTSTGTRVPSFRFWVHSALLTAPDTSSSLSTAASRGASALAHITPDRTLLEIARIAYADVASFFNDDNTLKRPSELNEEQRATLASFEACIQNVTAGDGHQDLIHKFKAWDKPRCLEMLARHFGMFQDKVTVDVTVQNDEINQRIAVGVHPTEAQAVNSGPDKG
jgi:hypothetical protein